MCALYGLNNRRAKVAEQLKDRHSPVFRNSIRYLPYSQLEQNHASMSRFGSNIKPLLEISSSLKSSCRFLFPPWVGAAGMGRRMRFRAD